MTRRFATVAIQLAILGSLLAGSVDVRSSVVPQALKLSFQPYAGEQHEVMPVQVLKFVVDLPADAVVDGNMFVHEWRLRNRSDKSVVRIRGALFIYGESEPEKLLLKYPDIHLGGLKLSPGQSWPRAAVGSLPTENASFLMISTPSSSGVAFCSFGRGTPEGMGISCFDICTYRPQNI